MYVTIIVGVVYKCSGFLWKRCYSKEVKMEKFIKDVVFSDVNNGRKTMTTKKHLSTFVAVLALYFTGCSKLVSHATTEPSHAVTAIEVETQSCKTQQERYAQSMPIEQLANYKTQPFISAGKLYEQGRLLDYKSLGVNMGEPEFYQGTIAERTQENGACIRRVGMASGERPYRIVGFDQGCDWKFDRIEIEEGTCSDTPRKDGIVTYYGASYDPFAVQRKIFTTPFLDDKDLGLAQNRLAKMIRYSEPTGLDWNGEFYRGLELHDFYAFRKIE